MRQDKTPPLKGTRQSKYKIINQKTQTTITSRGPRCKNLARSGGRKAIKIQRKFLLMAMRLVSPRRIKIIRPKNPPKKRGAKQINANVFPVTEIQFQVPKHLLPMIMTMMMMIWLMLTVANSIRALGMAPTLGNFLEFSGINLFLGHFRTPFMAP